MMPRDHLVERNVERNQQSTSRSLPGSTNSDNSKEGLSDSKVMSGVKANPHRDDNNKGTRAANSKVQLNNLSEQFDNMQVDNEGGDQVNQNSRKKKNAIKKERLKKLQIPTESRQPETVQSAPAAPTQNGITSVHDYFLKQIAPLYANTSSRYLENQTHHPQYQMMQSMHFRNMYQNHHPMAASVPNTPFFQQAHYSNSRNFQNSPVLHQVSPPKFLQNALQHPLLSQNFKSPNNHNHHNFYPSYPGLYPQLNNGMYQHAQNVNNSVPSKGQVRQRKNTKEIEDKRFESYMSKEEVELQLNKNKDTLLEGVLRINPKQFQNSYVSSADRSEQDILIDSVKNRNRGLEGDVVVVQYIESDSDDNNESNNETKQKKGKVVYIREKVHNRTCIGVLKLMSDKNRQKALFTPRDHRIPRLYIPFTSWPDNFYEDSKRYENTLFLAKILDWTDVRFATGKIICNIGQSGDMQTETKAILAQTSLDITPFGPEVHNLYPRLDYIIPQEEISKREDCRKLCIFSIDPSNCRDIDDAVSCLKLDNGNYEIGVHISDVAHYLTENTILDEKVAEKATTIYLVERAYHMLPDDLCMLCSLFPGVDKLAFSVFWEITEEAKVVKHRFAKTVINSCGQLAYDHAQAILDNTDDAEKSFPETYNGFNFKDIQQIVKVLGKLSAIMRKERFEGGALRIDQPKVSFRLSPTNGLPESFWIYESKTSHQLIEEFMLLANMTVAERIHNDYPELAFLRCHPAPSMYMLKQLAKSLKPMGIDLDIETAGNLYNSLRPHVGPESADRGKVMVLNMLCAKPMTRAKYFCAGGPEDDFHHYALNVPLYTHFTSPIRRYADIMVHRLLAASLKYREVPKWDVSKVCMIAAQCNKQKYNAKRAGELSTELYTLKYIELNSPLVTEAVVVEVREKYIDVIIVAMGLNRRIFFNSDFPGEHKCIKNDAGTKLSKMELKWKSTENLPAIQQVIEVFSILQVEMHKGDDMVKVETKLVRPQ